LVQLVASIASRIIVASLSPYYTIRTQ